MRTSSFCEKCGTNGKDFEFSSHPTLCLECYKKTNVPYITKVEKLAELEHIQWSHWTKYMLDNMTPENIARWRRQIETPYSELSEKEKDSDREWAIKALEITDDIS